jgi:hypothetical protein
MAVLSLANIVSQMRDHAAERFEGVAIVVDYKHAAFHCGRMRNAVAKLGVCVGAGFRHDRQRDAETRSKILPAALHGDAAGVHLD